MALLRYSALRIALFVGVGAVLYLVGVRNLFICALIAILVSGLVSVVALKGPRSEVGAGRASEPKVRKPRQSPLKKISDRIDAAARAEDEADDAERAELGHALPPIPRPDLPGWEDHIPDSPESLGDLDGAGSREGEERPTS